MSLILIMGIPASGKSTFRRKMMANSAPNLLFSTSFDEFRENFSLPNARENRKSFQCHVESELSRTTRPIWLIEDIFYLQSMRRAFQRMAKRRGFQFGVVLLKADVDEAIRRNLRRKEGIQTEETIRKVFEAMEEPVEVENSVVLEDSDDVNDIGCLLKILKLQMVPVPALKSSESSESPESPESPPESSYLESLDVITRRLVSDVIKTGGFDGKKLSEARKRLLLNSRHLQNLPDVSQLIDIYNTL